MIPGTTTLATWSVATLPLAHAVADPLQLLLADPDAELLFVLAAYPQPLAGLDSDFPYALATEPLAALDEAEEGEDHTILLSDRGYTTGADEDPPHRHFPPRLATAFNFESAIPRPGRDDPATLSYGEIRIANGDRAYDHLLDYSWTGRRVDLLVGGTLKPRRHGERRLKFHEFGTMFRGTVEAIEADDTSLRLTMRDPAARLERVPPRTLFAGTGGLEGGEDLDGLAKPIGWGRNRNVPPVQLDAVDLVYMLSAGPIQAVLAVRDKGISLGFAGDHADLAALLSASLAPGDYATCLALGVLRLGAPPGGRVTADFEGDISSGYPDTAAAIVRRLATLYGGFVDPDEIDAAAFAGLAAPQAMHLWLGPQDGRTIDQLIRTLMDSVEGWVGFTRDGRLTLGLHRPPEVESATTDIEAADEIGRSLAIVQSEDPVWRARIGYDGLELVQSADELAEGVAAEERAYYGRAHRFAPYVDSVVEGLHARPRDVERATQIDDPADAADLARTIVLRDGQIRRVWSLDVARGLLRFRPGAVVRLTSPRYGLGSGRPLRVMRVVERANMRTVRLDLWG
ncbi:hypothetical protein ABIE65_005231 [Constrictibacter sp. MBR-5]|jgi:hypothetical protein|uniref:hypothetical protein n=1 Tax=Constrictibacter sp. MBR-5 TaxID=3156467 RepID=UPI003393A9BA